MNDAAKQEKIFSWVESLQTIEIDCAAFSISQQMEIHLSVKVKAFKHSLKIIILEKFEKFCEKIKLNFKFSKFVSVEFLYITK